MLATALPLGNWLPVAVAADAVKSAADAPLTLKPGQELPKGKWVDVMTPVDPDWDTVSGAWHRGNWDAISATWGQQGSELRVAPSLFQRIMLPVELEGSYELKAEFTRLTGANSIEIVFPIGKRSCMLNLAARRESLHGLSSIDGRDVADRGNPAVFRPAKLIDKQRYTVLIFRAAQEGNKAKIEAFLWTITRSFPGAAGKNRSDVGNQVGSAPKPLSPGTRPAIIPMSYITPRWFVPSAVKRGWPLLTSPPRST